MCLEAPAPPSTPAAGRGPRQGPPLAPPGAAPTAACGARQAGRSRSQIPPEPDAGFPRRWAQPKRAPQAATCTPAAPVHARTQHPWEVRSRPEVPPSSRRFGREILLPRSPHGHPQPPTAPRLAHARSHARLGTGTPWVLAHTRSPSLCTKTSSNPCTPCLPLVCAHSHRYQSGPCALPNLQTSLAVPGTLRPRSPGRVLPRPSTVPPFPLGQGAAQGPGTPHPAPTTSSPRVPTGTAGTGTGHTAKTGLGSRQETVPRRPPSPPPSMQSPSAPTLQGTV